MNNEQSSLTPPDGESRVPGRGRGRQPGGFGLGPEGFCVCPNCGHKVPHQRGIPCYKVLCPKCDTPMMRNH